MIILFIRDNRSIIPLRYVYIQPNGDNSQVRVNHPSNNGDMWILFRGPMDTCRRLLDELFGYSRADITEPVTKLIIKHPDVNRDENPITGEYELIVFGELK